MNKTEAILNIDILIKEIENQTRIISAMRGNGKTILGYEYITHNLERLEALYMAKEALANSPEGCPEGQNDCTDDWDGK